MTPLGGYVHLRSSLNKFHYIPLDCLIFLLEYSLELEPCNAGELVSAVAVVCACPRDNDNPTQPANSNFLLLNITFKCTSSTEKVSSFRVKIRYYIHFNILLNPDIEKKHIFIFQVCRLSLLFKCKKILRLYNLKWTRSSFWLILDENYFQFFIFISSFYSQFAACVCRIGSSLCPILRSLYILPTGILQRKK